MVVSPAGERPLIVSEYKMADSDIDPKASEETAKVEISEKETINVLLRFRVNTNLPGRYVHHLLIQPGENEMILSFFEVVPPLLIGSEEERRLTLREGIRAECVARIIVAKARYPAFVEAMQSVLQEVMPVKLAE